MELYPETSLRPQPDGSNSYDPPLSLQPSEQVSFFTMLINSGVGCRIGDFRPKLKNRPPPTQTKGAKPLLEPKAT